MTLADKLRKEGEIRGKREGLLEGEIKGKLEGKLEGEIRGLNDAIELGMTLKFPDQMDAVMIAIEKIRDVDTLRRIKDAIKTAKDGSEILVLIRG